MDHLGENPNKNVTSAHYVKTNFNFKINSWPILLYLKKVIKLIGKVLLGFIALLLLYLGSAFVLSRITVEEEPNEPDEITIYILTNGVHTDIVMPVTTAQIDWSEQIKYENTKEGDSSYSHVAMGWGDKGFYLETPTWGDLKASTAIKAATGRRDNPKEGRAIGGDFESIRRWL